MRPKSIDCVRALVDIALEDGNYLAESWGLVLRYISQLARLQASLFPFSRCMYIDAYLLTVFSLGVLVLSPLVCFFIHADLGFVFHDVCLRPVSMRSVSVGLGY